MFTTDKLSTMQPIPKELETIYMTDNQTTVADFIRSRPAASAPYLIATALTCRQYKYPMNSCELHCTARALRYNRAELQIATRTIQYEKQSKSHNLAGSEAL